MTSQTINDDIAYANLIREADERVLAKVALIFAIRDRHQFLEIYNIVRGAHTAETYTDNFLTVLEETFTKKGSQNAIKLLRDARNFSWVQAESEVRKLAERKQWKDFEGATIVDANAVAESKSVVVNNVAVVRNAGKHPIKPPVKPQPPKGVLRREKEAPPIPVITDKVKSLNSHLDYLTSRT